MTEQYIYHLIGREEWSRANQKGILKPESLQKEGFIHFCEKSQIETVLEFEDKPEDELEELKIGKMIEEFEDSDPEKLEKEVDEMPYDHLKKMYEFLNNFLENHGDVIKKDYHSH